MAFFSAMNVEYLSWIFQNNCDFIYIMLVSIPFSVFEKRGKKNVTGKGSNLSTGYSLISQLSKPIVSNFHGCC